MDNITIINLLQKRIKKLERENENLKLKPCRFNCRTSKENFMAGYESGHKDGGDVQKPDPDWAFKEWKGR